MSYNPANVYLFKVNNRNTRKRCKVYSKLIKTPERRQWLVLVSLLFFLLLFLLLTLNKSKLAENHLTYWTIFIELINIFSVSFRGVFRTLSDSYGGVFCKNSEWLTIFEKNTTIDVRQGPKYAFTDRKRNFSSSFLTIGVFRNI